MNLIDRLRTVYPSLRREAFESYVVRDLVGGPEVKVVLLCESPHTDEVNSTPPVPLVGPSGVSVANVLLKLVVGSEAQNSQSVGQLVRDHDDRFQWLGLMNACCVPMQKKVYCNSVRANHGRLLAQLEKIRKRKEAVHLQCAVECTIKDDLKARWERVRDRHSNILLIPCGSVARRFCRLAGITASDGLKTPHPSRNQWEAGVEICMTMARIREASNGLFAGGGEILR